jgi:hypothetical protein
VKPFHIILRHEVDGRFYDLPIPAHILDDGRVMVTTEVTDAGSCLLDARSSEVTLMDGPVAGHA